MKRFLKNFIEGWRIHKPRERPSRIALAYRFTLERQQIVNLRRELDEARKQLNEGPSEGAAFVWRERLKAAELGQRRIAKDRARLSRAHRKILRENKKLKKELDALKEASNVNDD